MAPSVVENMPPTNAPVLPPLAPTNAVKDIGSNPVIPPLPLITNAPRPQPVVTNVPGVAAEKEPSSHPDASGQARPVKNLFEAQIALSRLGISCGSIDGISGNQTRDALRVFQHQQELPQTGGLDAATKLRLTLSAPVTTNYVITQADLDRLMSIPKTWLGKSTQTRLDFETILELVAEKAHAHPSLIRKLNPNVNWDGAVSAGSVVVVPVADYPPAKVKASYLRIHLQSKTLEAFDAVDHLLAHFPCSIARQVEKRPVGVLRVVVVAENPNYVFKPEIFPESAEARELGRKLVLPSGPNNPVGLAWIGLDKPGYGIHGTPKPEEVGRTESHGCFRLANWNAGYLAQLVQIGVPVYIDP
jgi:lipoprotein-anchoring transpeptidase ErfK/SrfK